MLTTTLGRVASDDLVDFTTQVLRAIGLAPDDARAMARQIVGSELAGHESHGLRRLTEYVDRARSGDVNTDRNGVVVDDRGSTLTIDGQGAFGHLVMRTATAHAVDRARRYGVAAVAVRNSAYAGRLADFCEEAAARGVATLVFANSSGSAQVAAAPGAREARLSTNPIAAGIPRPTAPHLVIDMATTAVAMGRVSEWRDRGEPIPDDWVNEDGVLQFMGGVKGFGLALVAEALAGALSGAGTVSSSPAADGQGVLLLALDVERFRPLPDFTGEVERFAHYVKDVPLTPGSEPIRLPGERSARTAEERRASGIALQPFTWSALLQLAEDLHLRPPAMITLPDKKEHP